MSREHNIVISLTYLIRDLFPSLSGYQGGGVSCSGFEISLQDIFGDNKCTIFIFKHFTSLTGKIIMEDECYLCIIEITLLIHEKESTESQIHLRFSQEEIEIVGTTQLAFHFK